MKKEATLLHHLEKFSALIDSIEAEMKRIGYWNPRLSNLLGLANSGALDNYLEAPTFELWLQYILVPRARKAVSDRTLPAESNVGVMAVRQYDYHSHIPEAQQLLDLLCRFDAAIKEYHRLEKMPAWKHLLAGILPGTVFKKLPPS